MPETLRDLVAEELAHPVDARVADMAAAIAQRYGNASRAVLFYGSCLRTAELQGQMLDFYLIVSDYREAYGRSWLAHANRLIPPNVFPFEHEGLAAKFAVLSEADFQRECGLSATSVSVWARFAQPSRLVWFSDDSAAEHVIDSVANAAPTLFQFTLPMLRDEVDPFDIWKRGFALTYGAELRSERRDRSSGIVEAWPERYRTFTDPTLAAVALEMGVGPEGQVSFISSPQKMAKRWQRMQRKGKALSVLRLAKASATFAGGIDYLAWKINRHAGTNIVIKPWQRRWPLLGAVTLLPRLLKGGAIR
jgi:hypothetical protein